MGDSTKNGAIVSQTRTPPRETVSWCVSYFLTFLSPRRELDFEPALFRVVYTVRVAHPFTQISETRHGDKDGGEQSIGDKIFAESITDHLIKSRWKFPPNTRNLCDM